MRKFTAFFIAFLIVCSTIGCDTEHVLESLVTSEVHIPQRYPAGDIQIKAPKDKLYNPNRRYDHTTLSSFIAMSDDYIFVSDMGAENIYLYDHSGSHVKTIKRPPIRGNTIGFHPSEVNRPNDFAEMSFIDNYLYMRVSAEIAPTWGRDSVVRIDPETEEIETFIRQHEAYSRPSLKDGFRVFRAPGYEIPLFKARGYYWTPAAEQQGFFVPTDDRGNGYYSSKYIRRFFEARDPDTNAIIEGVPWVELEGNSVELQFQNTTIPQHDWIGFYNAQHLYLAHDPNTGVLFKGFSSADLSGVYFSAYSDLTGEHLFNVKVADHHTEQQYYTELEFVRDMLYVCYFHWQDLEVDPIFEVRCFR